MAITPYQLFNTAHERAESFLKLDSKGRKADDDLRAAVVFAVASIDAYFRIKIISHIKGLRDKNASNFILPTAAQDLIKDVVSKSILGKQFKDLDRKQIEVVNLMCESNKTSLITYLEAALKSESFQSIEKMSEGIRVMGQNPKEIWGRFDTSTMTKSVKKKDKKAVGRPIKNKLGRKIDAKVQLGRLFTKRHLIVHEADLTLRGRKSVGKPRLIQNKFVKRWLSASKETINRIDKLIA